MADAAGGGGGAGAGEGAGGNKPKPKSALKTRRNNRGAGGAGAAPRHIRFNNAASTTQVFNWNVANKENTKKHYHEMIERSKSSRRQGLNVPSGAYVYTDPQRAENYATLKAFQEQIDKYSEEMKGRIRNIKSLIRRTQQEKLRALPKQQADEMEDKIAKTYIEEMIAKKYQQLMGPVQDTLLRRHAGANPEGVRIGALAESEAKKLQAEYNALHPPMVAEDNNSELENFKQNLEAMLVKSGARGRPASAGPVRPALLPAEAAAGGGGGAGESARPITTTQLPPLTLRRTAGASAGGLNLSRFGEGRSLSPSPARASLTLPPVAAAAAGGAGARSPSPAPRTAAASPLFPPLPGAVTVRRNALIRQGGIGAGAAGGGGGASPLGAAGLRGLLGAPGSLPPIAPRAAGGLPIGTALGGSSTLTLPKKPNKPQGGGKRKTRKAKKSRRRRV